MSKLLKLSMLCILTLTGLTLTVLVVARRQSPALDDRSIHEHGSDGSLLAGDLMVLWGSPQGLDSFDDEYQPGFAPPFNRGDLLWDIRWPGHEVDVVSNDFSPWSRVLYANAEDRLITSRWPGFVCKLP